LILQDKVTLIIGFLTYVEEFHTLRDQYIRQGEGFIVVFGINNRNSFEEAQAFIKQILTTKEIAEENFGTAATDAAIILIGNKADLDKERTVTAEEAKQLAARYGGLTYFEASAKHRQNVEEAFMTAAREVCVKVKSKREEKKCLIM
jgi:GTPase SAR1 family protein